MEGARLPCNVGLIEVVGPAEGTVLGNRLSVDAWLGWFNGAAFIEGGCQGSRLGKKDVDGHTEGIKLGLPDVEGFADGFKLGQLDTDGFLVGIPVGRLLSDGP